MKSLLSNIKGSILLAVVWGIVIITGFLALGVIVGGIESLVVFGRVHNLAVRAGLVYTVAHAFRYRAQIMSYFGIKIGKCSFVKKLGIVCKSPRCNCALKITVAIALHILFHMVSIHLAMAYTVVHVVQHRHCVSSLIKKISHNRNVHRNHSWQIAQLVA